MPELTRRYIVMTMATEGPFDLRDPDTPFVLKPWKDPAALRALQTYREHCYPELAEELEAWIATISAGPAVRGGVGTRNEQHIGARARASAKRPPARRQKPEAKTKVVRGKKVKKKARGRH